MAGKLEHALRFAAEGLYVFPVNDRTPAVPWREASTTDPERIRNWWIDPVMGWPQDYNIGIDTGKSGLFILDVDVKNGKPGLQSYTDLALEVGSMSNTRRSQTASGGFHYWFKNEGFANSAGYLGDGLDTRGDGGMIIAPGSTTEKGEYKFLNDAPIMAMPEGLKARMASKKTVLHRDTGRVISEDEPGDVEWAKAFLKEHEPAIEGAGGDNHTFKTFCQLKERGISIGSAIDLADEHWNHRCSPPWELSDLIAKANSAYKSAQNATGVKTAQAEFDLDPAEYAAAAEKPKLRILDDDQHFRLEDIPHRQFVFGNIALRKNVTIIGAPPGMGKSTITLAIGVSKATGRDILGIDPRGRGRVAVVNNEDTLEELRRRTGAILQNNRIPMSELFDEDVRGEAQQPFLYLKSGENDPLIIAKRHGITLRPHHLDALAQELIDRQIDILIVDPFAETHQGKENENEEIGRVARMYRAIAQRANNAVILVHHTRKLDGASGEGHSGNMDSLRGASSLVGVARVVVTFNTMTEKQAKQYGVKPSERHFYVLLEGAKANFGAPGEHKMWFKRETERINPTEDNPDGEGVGVLRPVQLIDKESAPDEAEKSLLADIESLICDGAKTVTDVATALVSSFAMHTGKQPDTLERAIKRLFADGERESDGGWINLEERTKAQRNSPKYWLAFRRARTLDDL